MAIPTFENRTKLGYSEDRRKTSERGGVTFAEVFGVSVQRGQAGQFDAARAGALRVRFFRFRRVATAHAEELLLGLPEHGPELVAQHTVGATYNLLRHYCWFSFIVIPSFSFSRASVELQGSGVW